MGNFRKNTKKAAMATKTVDKAQNALMKRMNKKLDELEQAVETKYQIMTNQDAVSSYNGLTVAGREDQIVKIDIGINQGTSDTERIGDQVTFKHIDFEYQINLPFMRVTEHSQPVYNTRVMLFWDSQPSAISAAGGTVPNPAYWNALLQYPGTLAPTDADSIQNILCQKNWDQRKRFQIIYDKVHTLSSNASGDALGLGARATTGVVSFSKTYVGQKLRYVGGGTIVQNRQLYLAYTSDQEQPAGSPSLLGRRPEINYNIRCLYDDI